VTLITDDKEEVLYTMSISNGDGDETSVSVNVDSPANTIKPEDRHFNWHSENDEDSEENTYQEKKSWFRRATLFVKWLVLTALGLIFLVAPTILWYFYFKPVDVFKKNTERNWVTEVFRALVFLSTGWMGAVIAYAITRSIPYFILRFCQKFLRGASEKTKTRLEVCYL
jgi:hypothetical protein